CIVACVVGDVFFFSSRRRHTSFSRDWSSDVCSSDLTRHICVEGWSAIGKWGGVRFSDFLRRVGADLRAKYVGFKCADDYYTSIRSEERRVGKECMYRRGTQQVERDTSTRMQQQTEEH